MEEPTQLARMSHSGNGGVYAMYINVHLIYLIYLI